MVSDRDYIPTGIFSRPVKASKRGTYKNKPPKMAMRRHSMSYDDWVRPEYGTMVAFNRSPRKQTAIDASNQFLRNSYPYRNKYRVDERDPAYRYVGKILIPWNGESTWDYADQLRSIREAAWRNGSQIDERYIHEYDIARESRGSIYRILYARRFPDGKFYLVSKASQERRAARMNLIVNAEDNTVLAVSYY